MSGTGVDARKVLGELRRLRAKAPELSDQLMGQWAEGLTSEAKHDNVVPFKIGNLQKSHGWSKLREGVWRIEANIVYAAAVHENHPTKSRWFAKAIAEHALPTLAKTVERIKRALGM